MSDKIPSALELIMTQQAESLNELTKSVQQLVKAESERTVRDEFTQKEVKSVKDYQDRYDDGVRFANKVYQLVNNWFMKVAFPLIMTLLSLALLAQYVDIKSLGG